MGGNAAAVKVFKADGTPVGTYKANHFSDTNFPCEGDGDGKGSWGGMRTHIDLLDTGNNGSWSHAFFDEVVTYYETVPDIANGFDTVTAPLKANPSNPEDWGEVQLKWCIAVKEE